MRTYTLHAKKGEDLRNPATVRAKMAEADRLARIPKKPSCIVSVEKLETVIRVLEDWVHLEHGALVGSRGYDMEHEDYDEFKLARQLRGQVNRAKAKFAAK